VDGVVLEGVAVVGATEEGLEVIGAPVEGLAVVGATVGLYVGAVVRTGIY